jgi:hypothetical protein
MVQKQIDVRTWCDGSQALQEFMRGKDQVARAVVPRMAEGADDAAVGESREPFLRERWAQKVPAEPLEPETVVGADGAIGVLIETFEVRVTRADRPHPRGIGRIADAQHGRAGAVAERRPTANGRGADLREHRGIDRERIGFEVRRVVRGEHPTLPQ